MKATLYCLYDSEDGKFIPETLHVSENDELEFWKLRKYLYHGIAADELYPDAIKNLSSVPITGIDLDAMSINPDDIFRNDLVDFNIWPDNFIPVGEYAVKEFEEKHGAESV